MPRPGLCWYCGRPWLRVGDPPDHFLLAALGARLTTDRCCAPCNRALNTRVDQPALSDWLIAIERRRAGLRDTRRGAGRSRQAARPEQHVTTPDGARVVADLSHPDLIPVQVTEDDQGVLVVGGRADERHRLAERIERTARERGRQVTVREQPIPPKFHVSIRADFAVWPRFIARAALGALSREGWSDEWLQSDAARRLRGWLWDGKPRDDTGAGPLHGLLRRPPTWAARACPQGGHLLAWYPGRDGRAALHVVLFGRHWQTVIVDPGSETTPISAWRIALNKPAERTDFRTLADALYRQATGRPSPPNGDELAGM